MQFTKMQGAGNDYIYVNEFEENVPEDVATLAWIESRLVFCVIQCPRPSLMVSWCNPPATPVGPRLDQLSGNDIADLLADFSGNAIHIETLNCRFQGHPRRGRQPSS